MIDKFVPSLDAALEGIADGASVMIGGFGAVGQPDALVDGLLTRGLRDLVVIANNAGGDFGGLPKLIEQGAVAKVICSYPRAGGKTIFDTMLEQGRIALEIVPQGTLAERIRAAGAGVPAFYTPTGAGTRLAEGKETRIINGQEVVLEHALSADFALVRAWQADRWGNLTYRGTGRNFNPIMATAARITIAVTDHVRPLGALDPEQVMTPGIFVQRVFAAGAES